MATKKCDICGKEFTTPGNGRTCPACHTQHCAVCGKEIHLTPVALSKFKKQGFITCSRACATEHTKRMLMETEGITNVFQRPEVRAKLRGPRHESKEIHERRCAVNRETANRPEVIAKRKATNLKRYGYEYQLQRPEVRAATVSAETMEKRKRNAGHKYGVGCYTQTDEFQAKKQATCLEKYGDAHTTTKSRKTIKKYTSQHRGASISEVADHTGLAYHTVAQQHEAFGLDIDTEASYFEDIIASFLDGLGVHYVRNDRTVIAPKELDFYCPDQKVAIEVNDLVTHNLDFNPYGGEPKPKGYHWEKTKACDEKGIRLIHCWEQDLPCSNIKSGRIGSWEVMKNIITHALGMSKNRVYARKTKVVEFPATETKGFFDANNINGYRRAKTTYALVPKVVENPVPDDILMGYAVGNAYFGKGKYDAEIARGACRLGYTVVGGASKLWNYIIKNTDYGSLIYYCDRNFYCATSMSFLDNVEYVSHSRSFWNYFVETGELKNRDPGHDKEIRQARRDGLVWEVENAGTDVYLWHRV